MYSFLKDRGRKIADALAETEIYFTLTPARLSLLQTLKLLVDKYSRGKLLDAGAGRLAWKCLLAKNCSDYVSIDVLEGRKRNVDILVDIQCMGITDQSFDTIFCSQVLEHVPEPQRAIDEFYRILVPEGMLILSAPHLSHLHNEPSDYCRFTKYGLKVMLEKAGFEIIQMKPAGGLLSFMGFVPATILLNLLYDIPLLGRLSLLVCQLWSRLVVFFDNHLEKRKIYALNYAAVARRQ